MFETVLVLVLPIVPAAAALLRLGAKQDAADGQAVALVPHDLAPRFAWLAVARNIDTAATFRTWSMMETVVSVLGLALILLSSHLL